MSADRSFYKRGNRLTTTIEIGCPTSISVPRTSSLPPLYATPPHGSYATPLRLFSVPRPLPRHRVVAFKSALSRVRSQCPTPLSRPLLSPAAAASIALPSRLSISTSRSSSLLRIAQPCATFPLTLRRYDDCWQPHQIPFPPPPRLTPLRIIKSADQKLKVGSSSALPFLFPFSPSLPFLLPPPMCLNANDAFVVQMAGPEERPCIVAPICARGFGNWAVQRCLEAATGPEERRKIVACMRGRIVDLATNCYGYLLAQEICWKLT
ncbi:hypothetical protein B0H13DRAFT_2656459 [Mycena leptocephala]|nr:hypothetical protein B0H13DRAFT_2656459 [Mycena leptocephala]